MGTPAQIWTSLVKLTEALTGFTTPSIPLPPGSPILHTMILESVATQNRVDNTPTHDTSLTFLELFMSKMTDEWKSQDSVLLSYAETEVVSSIHYTRKYHTIDKCTRFSTFVEHEVDKSTTTYSTQGEKYNVVPESLTNTFIAVLRKALIIPALLDVPATATPAGLLFWTQFSSANLGDKVTLIIDDIYVDVGINMKPKCADDAIDAYTGYFGVEIKCT
jgi:hypothetical protein